MSEFKVNTDMFGQYVTIPTGYSKEKHLYKVVSKFYSNTYCDVPIMHNAEPKSHKETKAKENPYGLETVLNVIHCGIDENEVITVALKDCEVVKPKTNADHIRSMSDEELVKFIVGLNDHCLAGIGLCDCSGKRYCSDICENKTRKWLQSEVKE